MENLERKGIGKGKIEANEEKNEENRPAIRLNRVLKLIGI